MGHSTHMNTSLKNNFRLLQKQRRRLRTIDGLPLMKSGELKVPEHSLYTQHEITKRRRIVFAKLRKGNLIKNIICFILLIVLMSLVILLFK